MKTENIINKLTAISADYNSANSYEALNALILELKQDFQKSQFKIESCSAAFNKMVKRIYKDCIKKVRPSLAYACYVPEFIDYENYTVLCDSYSLIAKKSPERLNNVIYVDDTEYKNDYPNVKNLINLEGVLPIKIDREHILQQLSKIIKLKETKNKTIYFEVSENTTISFEPKRLYEMLSVVETDELLYHSETRPILVKNADYVGLVSPVRLVKYVEAIKIELMKGE